MALRNMPENYRFIAGLTEKVLSGEPASGRDGLKLLSLEGSSDVFHLLAHANTVRQHFRGPHIGLCAIVNARSGRCSEDCAFCAQSSRHPADIDAYPLMSGSDICAAARAAAGSGVHRFSIVTSGRGLSDEGALSSVCEAVRDIAGLAGIQPCASLGILDRTRMRQLRSAGLKRYHHNLETAESFFGQVCTTHTFADRIRTVEAAREEGLQVCCGGILGLGESRQQRVELALTLRELDVDSVPLNFLNPIAGTRLENRSLMPVHDILKAIALFRFMLPDREIRVCGGRERALRTLQPLIYLAGASGTMVGNYLTTEGRNIDVDKNEISDLGLMCD